MARMYYDSDANLDLLNGKTVATLDVGSSPTAVDLSPDGKTFATADSDTSILVWNVPDLSKAAIPQRKLSPRELLTMWDDLGKRDAARAWRSLWFLVGGGQQAVDFIAENMDAEVTIDDELNKLVFALDSDSFAERDQAMTELRRKGPQAAAALRHAQSLHLSAEADWRIDQLLENIGTTPVEDPKVLQQIRAVQVLEMIASPDAVDLLNDYAEGEAGAYLTVEAQRALRRLNPAEG